jgi:hypothetical protein
VLRVAVREAGSDLAGSRVEISDLSVKGKVVVGTGMTPVIDSRQVFDRCSAGFLSTCIR